MIAQPMPLHYHLRLIDRLVALVAWSLAIAIFFTIGWRVLRPVDPQGAVSMITCRHPWLMVAQMAALGMVTAALATVLVGRKLADAGVFATCLGIAVANLRADTLGALLISLADSGGETPPNIAAGFLFEAIIWFAIVVLAMVTSGLVLRWCFGQGDSHGFSVLSTMAVADMPLISGVLSERDADEHVAKLRTGVSHMLLTAVIAFALIGVLSTGVPARPIQHGQVYFSIAAAFCIAGYFAHGKFPARTPFWTCLAVPLVSVIAYLWVMLLDFSQGSQLPPSIPHSTYLRALPLEYVTLGTLGSILAFWWTRNSYAARMAGGKHDK